MRELRLLEDKLVALQKSHCQLRRIATVFGLCLALVFLLGAATGTAFNGDVSISGVLNCLQLQTDESATFTGDVTIKRDLSVDGALSTPEIKALQIATKDLDATALKVESFPILIYSTGSNLDQAKKDSGKNYDFVVEASPQGESWTHPRRFGSVVHAAWLVNERPDRGGSGFGAVTPSWNDNQVSLGLSSTVSQGVIEGKMFVLYSNSAR